MAEAEVRKVRDIREERRGCEKAMCRGTAGSRSVDSRAPWAQIALSSLLALGNLLELPLCTDGTTFRKV
jgi:hypothetical protein